MTSLTVQTTKTDGVTDRAGTGHPLTDNLPVFAAYRAFTASGSLVVNASARCTLTSYDNTRVNFNNMLDASTGVFTCAVKGLYQINAQASINHVNITHFDIAMLKNGTAVEPAWTCDRPAAWATASVYWISGGVNTVIDMNAGDTLAICLNNMNVSNQTVTNVTMRYAFSAFMVKRTT